MKFSLLLAAAAIPAVVSLNASARNVDWDLHDPTESVSFSHNVSHGDFIDWAQFRVTGQQALNNGVKASIATTAGSFTNLVVEFWLDAYGPDQYLASFKPGETFRYDFIYDRRKYYYLVKGSTPTGTASTYRLDSMIVPDAASAGPAAGSPVSPVPEPSTYVMMALGLAALPLARRFKQRDRG